jgi:nucleotidyltransferase substrate binding protein (TIGR01987 family)
MNKLFRNEFKSKLNDLKTAISDLEKSIEMFNNNHDSVIFDGVIKRFEVSIDLSCQVLKYYLTHQDLCESSNPVVILRESSFYGLIKDVNIWYNMLKDTEAVMGLYPKSIAFDISKRISNVYIKEMQNLLYTLLEGLPWKNTI